MIHIDENGIFYEELGAHKNYHFSGGKSAIRFRYMLSRQNLRGLRQISSSPVTVSKVPMAATAPPGVQSS